MRFHPEFIPTPAEIAAATLEIRQTWTERETLLRAGLDPDYRFTVPRARLTGEAAKPHE